ncbi:MAG TPA: hypothetical protein VMW72_13160 [Sedimentisphaerales bacterium]|nr:hypothetical protein [Sedimentisphaerales bacterium]
MSKVKRLKRKRAMQKKTNIRQMDSEKKLGATLKPRKSMKHMTRDHLDVLQNIEFALVSGYRSDRSIDDRIVADALRAAILDTEPENTRAQPLNESLEDIRELRADISDDIWQEGLRTVLQSVHRHSSLKPGCRLYLDFASDFVL